MNRKSIQKFRGGLLTVALSLALGASVASAQLPLFPGAEGFGGTFDGSPTSGNWFSDASVYHVTTLADSGPGSFRNAFTQHVDNKIIVFDVAGTINLASPLDIKNVENHYIAGQTAPGPVTITGNMTQITHGNAADENNKNIILRYLTFRTNNSSADDPLTFNGGGSDPSKPGRGRHMIVDHVSTSWGDDENLSVANLNTEITVQYSIMAEAIGSGHQYGSLIRPRSDAQVSFHHNLYANDRSRNPRPGTYNGEQLDLDFRNNVIYNWSDRAGYTGGASETAIEHVNIDYVGNYAIAGPSTPAGQKAQTMYTMDVSNFWNLATDTLKSDPKGYVDVEIYQSGNYIDSNKDTTRDGGNTGWDMFIVSDGTNTEPYPEFNFGPSSLEPAKTANAHGYPAVTTQSAPNAYGSVLNHVGNYTEAWGRDAIDSRILGNVANNTQPAGTFPLTAPLAGDVALVTAGIDPENWIYHPANWDTENNGLGIAPGDGMPTSWELEHGLDPNSSADAYLDFDGDGYINVLEYLNDRGAFPAAVPIIFNGATNNRYAQITNWKTDDGGITAGSNWQPSKYDEAQINVGTVVVDAVGQHTGLLKIGSNPGDNATLNITGGWLKVADELVVGADPGATAAVNLSGGELHTAELSKGAGGSFSMTGGELHADVVNFDLTNNGGILAPGHSAGQTHVLGDLSLASGDLEIELASAFIFDTLVVDGLFTLGGDLNIELLGAYAPTNGSWEIATADDFDGSFANITPGYSVEQQGNSLFLLLGTAGLLGDYNGDETIDAADYTVWRDALTAGSTSLTNDPTPGTVDESDFLFWRDHFGESLGGGSGQGSAAVPEPASSLLLFTAAIMLWIASRSRK